MSDDNSSINGCAWVFAFTAFFGMLGMARCGGGNSSSPASTPSPSGSSSSSDSYSASSTHIDSHEAYIRASEAERRQWSEAKEAELKRKGINNTSAKDLKDALDTFYSR